MVDKLDTFAERLKHLRKNAGMSLAAVAAQIGVSTQAVHKWENGGNIDGNKDMKLAELFNVNPWWLIHGHTPPAGEEKFPHELFDGMNLPSPPSAPVVPESGIFVPLLDATLVTNWIARKGPFDYHKGEWIACPREHSDLTYALKVQDSSMEDLGSKVSYSQGDIIFVDPVVTPWDNSRIILTGHNMEEEQQVIFRQLVIDGWVMCRRPLNKMWPEQQVKIQEYELPAGTVIGKWVSE